MARTFDGSNDQMAFGSESTIDDVQSFSAVAHVRITADVTSERQILAKMNSSYVGNIFIAAVGSGGNNNKIFSFRQATGGDPYAETVADALVVNTWRVVVVTFDSTNEFIPQRIYVGTLGGAIAEASYASNAAWNGSLESDASATLRVAARDPADATFFAGGLAESAIWNRVLSNDEIRALGRGFSPAFFPRGRVFYCPIDGRTSPERNWAGTTAGTVTEAAYLDHPPVIYPRGQSSVKKLPVATFKSAWARGANQMLGVRTP